MKTTTDKLFKLIKSMTPAEKRYFKRHYGSESNTLTHLYDAINIQKDYDEESIKTQFPGKVAINLKVYKFQLEQLLLKSLTSHRHGSNLGSKIRMGLEHFEILLEKNLLRMAEKQLKKTKQTCLNAEKYAYLPVILAKEAKLQQIQASDFSSEVPPIHEEATIYSGKMLAHYQESSKLNALIDFHHKSKLPLSKAELKSFLQKIAIPSPQVEIDKPIADRLIPTMIKGMQHLLIGEYQTAEELFAAVIYYFDQNGNKAIHFAHFYLNSLYGALNASFQLHDFSKIKDYLKLGQRFCEKNPLYQSKRLNFAAYEIQLAIQEGTCENFINKQLPKLEDFIEQLDIQDNLSTQLFYAWSALAALFAENELLSQELVQKIQEPALKKPTYINAFGRVLEFVLYFETPNFQKITQFLERIKEEKKIKLVTQDKLFFDCFLKFADELAIDPRSAKIKAQQFLEKIDQIPNEGTLIKLFQAFKLDEWLQAIVSENSFLGLLSNKKVA